MLCKIRSILAHPPQKSRFAFVETRKSQKIETSYISNATFVNWNAISVEYRGLTD